MWLVAHVPNVLDGKLLWNSSIVGPCQQNCLFSWKTINISPILSVVIVETLIVLFFICNTVTDGT